MRPLNVTGTRLPYPMEVITVEQKKMACTIDHFSVADGKCFSASSRRPVENTHQSKYRMQTSIHSSAPQTTLCRILDGLFVFRQSDCENSAQVRYLRVIDDGVKKALPLSLNRGPGVGEPIDFRWKFQVAKDLRVR